MYRPSNQTAKKFARLAGLLILSGGLLASCDGYSFIDGVQLLADPDITIPAGSVDFNLQDLEDQGFDVSQVLADLGTQMGGTASLYRTSETDEEMKILLHMPIAEVPLDFSAYLDEIDLTGGLGQSLEPQTFAVPEINFPQTVIPDAGAGTSFDIDEQILSNLNGGMETISITVVEPGLAGPVDVSQTVSLTTSGYTSATFASGSLDIPLTLNATSPDFVITVTGVSLLSGGVEVSSDNTTYNLSQATPSATISLPLATVSLDNNPQIQITMGASGGTAPTTSTISGTPGFSATTTVDDVSGLSFTEVINFDPAVVSLGDLGDFVSATIGSGEIAMNGSAIPAGWTGLTQTLNLAISQTGGINVPAADYNPASDSIVLAGQTIAAGDITMSGSLTISAVNATLNDLQTTTFDPSYTLDGGIDSFSSLTVGMAAGFEPTITINQDMSEMAEWVSSITFSSVGTDIAITNGLPAGNDIIVTVNSTALSINDSHTYTGAGSGATEDSYEFVSLGQTLSPLPASLDFTATISLAGYDSNNNTLTLSNITPGQSYTFGGEASVIADWSSVTVSPPGGSGISGTFPEDGSGLDLSAIAGFLPAGVTFDEIPVYLYMNGAPGGLNPNISLTATYTDSGSPTTNAFLTGAVMADAALPDLTPDAANTDFITLDATTLSTDSISDYLEETSDPPRTRPDFSKALGAAPNDLVVSYEVGVGSVDLQPEDLDPYSPDYIGNTTLTADLIIVVPVSFTVPAEGVPVTAINDMIVIESDVLGRTFPSTGDEEFGIETALDFLTGISVNIDYVNNTGISLEARVKAYPDTADPDIYGIEQTFRLDTGDGTMTIELSEEELLLVQEGAFIPDIELKIPGGTHTLSNNPELSLGMSVTVNSDINYTVSFGTDGEGN